MLSSTNVTQPESENLKPEKLTCWTSPWHNPCPVGDPPPKTPGGSDQSRNKTDRDEVSTHESSVYSPFDGPFRVSSCVILCHFVSFFSCPFSVPPIPIREKKISMQRLLSLVPKTTDMEEVQTDGDRGILWNKYQRHEKKKLKKTFDLIQ